MSYTPPSPPEPVILGGSLPLPAEDFVAGNPDAAPPANQTALTATLRLMNVYVQQLWGRLELIRDGSASLEQSAGLLALTTATIGPLATTLHAAGPSFPNHADSLARISSAWQATAASPLLNGNVSEPQDAQAQLREIALLERECRTMIYWTAYLTATARLREWLHELRPGYALLFHEIFKDEVPFIEERQRLLLALASAPQLLADTGGLIDGESGVVYRYEVDGRKRWRAVLWVLLALAVASTLVAGAGLGGLGLGEVSVATLAQGWAAALLGLIVHVGVTAAKRLRAGGAGAAALPVDQLSILASAKLGTILLRIGMLLVAYLGLVAGGLLASGTGLSGFLFSAFLAGYSLDSVVDLLSARLDQQGATQLSGLRSQPAS